jgi:hypothetical protein
LYKSIDGGATWSSVNVDASYTATIRTQSWNDTAMSSDGVYQVATTTTSALVYSSYNSGNTWGVSLITGGGGNTNKIAMSKSGKYQTVVCNAGYIYVSTDYGSSWIAVEADATRNWNGISMSDDGKYQLAYVNSSNIAVSYNYGLNWFPKTTDITATWTGCAVSSDGKYQIVTVSSNYIMVSNNYGDDFTPKYIPSITNSSGVAFDPANNQFIVSNNTSSFLRFNLTDLNLV